MATLDMLASGLASGIRSPQSSPTPTPSVDGLPAAASLDAVPAADSRPIIVLCSKRMTQEDQDIFAEFGNVVVWVPKYNNVPLSQITPFAYLLVDITDKTARIMLSRNDLSQYRVISYVSPLHKLEDFIVQTDSQNVITSIPAHCVNQSDFENALLNPKLVSPNLIRTILKYLLGCLAK